MAITVVVSQSSSKNMIKIIDKNSRARVEGVAYYKPHSSRKMASTINTVGEEIIKDKLEKSFMPIHMVCTITIYTRPLIHVHV